MSDSNGAAGVPGEPCRSVLLRNTGGDSYTNYNPSLDITLVGTRSNRDAIGTHIAAKFNRDGLVQVREVYAGTGYLSADTNTVFFARPGNEYGRAKLHIQWPSGINNVLYGLRPGSEVTIPEINCDPIAGNMNRREFKRCYIRELRQAINNDLISWHSAIKLYRAALRGKRAIDNGGHWRLRS